MYTFDCYAKLRLGTQNQHKNDLRLKFTENFKILRLSKKLGIFVIITSLEEDWGLNLQNIKSILD